MSEAHPEEHSSPIKTPKQLIIVILLAFLVPIGLIVMLTQLVTGSAGFGKDHPGMTEEAIAKRLKPVGDVAVTDANAPKVEKSGQQVYDMACAACHATGALNAPKIGDRADWLKRGKNGIDALALAATRGHDNMPARGGMAELTDGEFRGAVLYMFNQSGGNAKDAKTEAPAAAPAKADAGKGKSVYEASCVACHAAGVAGAPKAGDKAAWAPRLKSGMPALYASTLKGKNAMPPKGGNMALSDDDVKAAVDYLAGLAK